MPDTVPNLNEGRDEIPIAPRADDRADTIARRGTQIFLATVIGVSFVSLVVGLRQGVPEPRFLDECTRCNAFVEACQHDAIVLAPSRFRAAAGTPMIDAHKQPCWMCHDTPCVTACEPGVLEPQQPIAMGLARVDTSTCLAYQNSFYTVCSKHCPVENAIDVVDGKPRINQDACTGCGVCLHVCPAPVNAILLTPTHDRGSIDAPNGPKETPSPAGAKPFAPWEMDMNRTSDPFCDVAKPPNRDTRDDPA